MDQHKQQKKASLETSKLCSKKILSIILAGILPGILLSFAVWLLQYLGIFKLFSSIPAVSISSTTSQPPYLILLLLFYLGYAFSLLSAIFQKGLVQTWYCKLPLYSSVLVSAICGIATFFAGGYILLLIFFFKSFLSGF